MRPFVALGLAVAVAASAASVPPARAARSAPALSGPASRELARADSMMRAGQWPEMFRALEAIWRGADGSGDRLLAQHARLVHGARLVLAGRDREAQPLLETSLAAARSLGDSIAEAHASSWLGASLLGQGRFAEARRVNQRTLALARRLGERSREAWALAGLGYGHLNSGQPRRARTRYTAALPLMRAERDANGACTVLIGLGRVASNLGEVVEARRHFLAADSLASLAGLPTQRGHALNNLGTLEALEGDVPAALAAYRGAMNLHRAAGNLRDAITPAGNVATTLSGAARNDEAAALLDSLLRDCRARGARDLEAQVAAELALVEVRAERPEHAKRHARMVLAGGAEVPLRVQARAVDALAVASWRSDSADAGGVLIERFLAGVADSLETATRMRLRHLLTEMRLEEGRWREARRQARLILADARRAGLRPAEAGALSVAGYAALRMGDEASARRELTAARSLWGRVPTGEVEGGATWRLDEARCALGLALLRLGAPDGGTLRAREAAHAMVQVYRDRSPAAPGAGAATGATGVSARELREQVLRPGELLLDACTGPDTTLVFGISRDGVAVVGLPSEYRLQRLLRPLRDLVSDPGDDGAVATGVDLARSGEAVGERILGLLATGPGAPKQVIFAPDGALHALPLEAMQAPDGRSLGQEIVLTRVSSAAMLARLRRRPRDARPVARIAILEASRPSAGSDLPGAAREATRLSTTYEGAVRLPLEDPGRVLAELGRCDVFHVAAHAEVDGERPWRSGLRLSRHDPARGSLLTAARIANVRAGARLATLAGCATAGGRVVPGVGVEGLASAFLRAGVPTVVATLWPVDDRVSAMLVERFYAELAAGHEAGLALTRVRRAIASSSRTRAPFYWAGFVLIGDGSRTLPLQPRRPLR
jgi:tetratricopeptide (TPR) repeat protein